MEGLFQERVNTGSMIKCLIEHEENFRVDRYIKIMLIKKIGTEWRTSLVGKEHVTILLLFQEEISSPGVVLFLCFAHSFLNKENGNVVSCIRFRAIILYAKLKGGNMRCASCGYTSTIQSLDRQTDRQTSLWLSLVLPIQLRFFI